MISLDLDFELLESEFQARACEHKEHRRETEFHKDGKEHWVLAKPVCPCHEPARVVVCCESFMQYASLNGLRCLDCGVYYDFWERYEDLGLIKDGLS